MSFSMSLAKAIETLVSPWGFQHIRKRDAFVRQEAHGFSEFLLTCHPTVSSGSFGHQYSLVAGVRHNSVEDVVNQLGLVYGAENQRATATVDRALMYFPIDPGRSYSVFLPEKASKSTLEAAASAISACVSADLLPFFSRYASLPECAQGLSTEPSAKSHALYNNYENRMYRAVASSCLSGAVSVIEQIEYWRAAYPSVLPHSAHTKVERRLSTLAGLLGSP